LGELEAFMKVPPGFSSTVTPAFVEVTARSGAPSPIRSDTATESAVFPKLLFSNGVLNRPLPAPLKTVTPLAKALALPPLATTTSKLPSPSKSATATESRSTPTGRLVEVGNVPSPAPKRTVKVPMALDGSALATTKSG
jgi:hypothetical protein